MEWKSPVHLSVTQLTCACTHQYWLTNFLQTGVAPAYAGSGGGGTGDGLAVHGIKIHGIAEEFIDWAVAKENWQTAADLDGDEGIYEKLQELGGYALTTQLAQAGKWDEAARLSENLERLAQHFDAQRKALQDFRTWGDIYLGQEYSIKNVKLTSSTGSCVDVSGIIDSLRLRNDRQVEVVDYKLTTGLHPDYELVQLAIYKKLLSIAQPHLKVAGCLEYLWPELKSVPATDAELQRIFAIYVEPVLTQICETVATSNGCASSVNPPPPPVPDQPVPTVHPVTVSPVVSPDTSPASPSPLLRIGTVRGTPNTTAEIDPAELTRHMAVLGGTGSGKTTAALNIIEQLVERGIPIVLLDRKGDLARYALDTAWDEAARDPALAGRAARLRARLGDIRVYTPGTRNGRALRLPLAPAGLQELSSEDRDLACRTAATSLADMLGVKASSPGTAVLTCAFQILSERLITRGIEVQDLILLIADEDPALLSAIGPLDPKYGRQLVQALQTFKIMQGHTLDPSIEVLSWERLLKPIPGQGRLTIINTKFLGNESATLFWVAQFCTELLRYVSRNPSPSLQGVLMLDEADIYLPATRNPVTKAPVESLLKRARSAGFGLMLCTQSPGDLDYKCRDNIGTWMLGIVKEKRAQEKLTGVLSDFGFDPQRLSKQKTGEFYLAHKGKTTAVVSDRNCIRTQQLTEDELLGAASGGRGNASAVVAEANA